jgi:hypothetical protein
VFQLFDELTDIQIASLQLAIGETVVETIFVTGGFSNSEYLPAFLPKSYRRTIPVRLLLPWGLHWEPLW